MNVNVTLFGNEIFVDDQAKMGSLGWALIQNVFVLITKGDLDTEIPTGRKPWRGVERKAEIGIMLL